MYRVHDTPDPLKLEALAQVLETFGLKLARGQVVRPKVLNGLLEKVAGRPEAAMVGQLVLRAQNQALYQPDNLGHFGLGLTHYAHFTSPIRRYADLLVHRALISGLRLGDDGLPANAQETFAASGAQISATERRSAAAERDAVDRFTAAYLADRIGAQFDARINGVTRFGLFVTLQETGADGLIPISTLPDDYYDHDERHHCLVGRRWGKTYQLGEALRVRLEEAVPLTGGMVFSVIEAEAPAEERTDSGKSAEWDPLREPAGPRKKRPSGGKASKSRHKGPAASGKKGRR
jgi:ribonuclease R